MKRIHVGRKSEAPSDMRYAGHSPDWRKALRFSDLRQHDRPRVVTCEDAENTVKIYSMDALFFSNLSVSHPVLRDHVRQGVEQARESHFSPDSETPPGVASSFAVLDAFLPWRGWPMGAMTEIMTDTVGCGELSLMLPAMARLTQEKRPILCIGAPHTLFAPALAQVGIDPVLVTQINPTSTLKHNKENLWSAEQALKTGLPGMVALWSPTHGHCPPETLRRLHLATIGRETMLIHFRGASCMSQPSPSWLRFGYAADDTHIRLQVLKCRGRLLTRPLITLDRASVQARLYGHFQATSALCNTIADGRTAVHTAPSVIAPQLSEYLPNYAVNYKAKTADTHAKFTAALSPLSTSH
jgi:protein ImuA